MKKFLLILAVLSISFFLIRYINFSDPDPVNQLVSKISKRLANKYELSFSGIGGGKTEEGVWLITVDFQRFGIPLDISQGRKLIVNLEEDFLFAFNEEEKIRPYLKEYPFTSKNMSIGIYFYDQNGKDTLDPYLDTISAHNGEIGYFTQDPLDKYKYKSKIYEPYTEALEKVKSEK